MHVLVYNKDHTVRPHDAGEHALTEGKITLVCTNDSLKEFHD